jgi:CheY-like chemotaxis protein
MESEHSWVGLPAVHRDSVQLLMASRGHTQTFSESARIYVAPVQRCNYPRFAASEVHMKVMIVDDNAEMRTLIRTLLEGMASEFVECEDGREAVAVFTTERPDWAVMDVAMRTMDGLTATRLITSQFPGSQIVVVTQHGNPKFRDRAREAGAAGFLMKEDLMELRSMLAAGANDDAKA